MATFDLLNARDVVVYAYMPYMCGLLSFCWFLGRYSPRPWRIRVRLSMDLLEPSVEAESVAVAGVSADRRV